MRKIFFICALAMISAWSWAEVRITLSQTEYDFGTVYLNQDGEAESDWVAGAILSWSGLIDYCSVFVDTIDAPGMDEACEFYICADEVGQTHWYGAVGQWAGDPSDPTVWIAFYALEAGEYSVKYHFYSYENDDDWYYGTNKVYGDMLTVKVKVVDPNDQGSALGMENVATKVESRKTLRNGRMIIERNGEAYTLTGAKL